MQLPPATKLFLNPDVYWKFKSQLGEACVNQSTTIIVCGGRNYNNKDAVFEFLDSLDPQPTYLIHGGAPGADYWAGQWARERGVQCAVYPADWTTHGRAAGPRRNQQMLDDNPEVVAVVSFPGGAGTADMIRRARRAGVPVLTHIELGACSNDDAEANSK